MKFKLFMMCLLPLSIMAKLPFKTCVPHSKDPRCWESRVVLGNPKIHCGHDGKVHLTTYHGEGSGCGESAKVIITDQKRDWQSKTITVTTKWQLPIHSGPPACHYWGPIYGGGAIDTSLGEWKVILDGKHVATYNYQIESEVLSDDESRYTHFCSLVKEI